MLAPVTVLEGANATVRFGLELCALLALGYWGFHASDDALIEWALGLGAPLAFAMTWGALVAPKAPYRLQDPARLILEGAVFAAAVAALAAAGSAVLAVVFMVAVALNIALMLLLGQRRASGI
jgi:hypothetical protein